MEAIKTYFPDLTVVQNHQFEQLKPLYSDWNSKINVISRKDMDDFYVHHVLHSLAIAKLIEFKAQTKVLDVGTGGGFPLIPLAIYFPEVQFLGVDSIGKKIKVIEAIAEELELKNVLLKHQRAEAVEGKYDFIVSRAVSRTQNLLSWVGDKIIKGGKNDLKNGFLLLKGGDLKQEMQEVRKKHKIYEISDFFKEDFFETKKIIHLPL